MIRDPSDGSVRTPEPRASGRQSGSVPLKPAMPSGLAPPDKDQANEAARLKRSREWLEEYYKRRGAE
jgi:hypothetical protein